MIEMELNKIVIDEKRHDQLIVLKEKGGTKLLPIVIGLNEASAIKLKISGFNPPRPLTHDLIFLITSRPGFIFCKPSVLNSRNWPVMW